MNSAWYVKQLCPGDDTSVGYSGFHHRVEHRQKIARGHNNNGLLDLTCRNQARFNGPESPANLLVVRAAMYRAHLIVPNPTRMLRLPPISGTTNVRCKSEESHNPS